MLYLLKDNKIDESKKIELLLINFEAWATITEDNDLITIGQIIINTTCKTNLTIDITKVITAMPQNKEKINILVLQKENISNNAIKNIVGNMKGYSKLIKTDGDHPTIEFSTENKELCELLEEKYLISSHKTEGNKLRVYQRRSN
ncbi:MAG: hypothetical protein ACRC4W_00945 [Treponemataceae bacterium]